MSAEFLKLARELEDRGFSDASGKTVAFAKDLEKRNLIPKKFKNPQGRSLPDFSYMNDLPDDLEVPSGTYQEQIRYYRKRLGLSFVMFGEVLGGLSASTSLRLETPSFKFSTVGPTLQVIEKLKLNKTQARNLVEAAGYLPQVIDLILETK